MRQGHAAFTATLRTGMSTGMSNFASKLGQIGTNLDKSGTFSDSISVHIDILDGPPFGFKSHISDRADVIVMARQNVLKLIIKTHRFVPFGVNLTLFGCKI